MAEHVEHPVHDVANQLTLPSGAEAERLARCLVEADRPLGAPPITFCVTVTASYFQTLGAAIESGRSLTAAEVRSVKPDIVYAQCSGFGASGPYAMIPTMAASAGLSGFGSAAAASRART